MRSASAPWRLRAAAIGAAAAASIALAACGGGTSSANDRTITLYNGQHPQTTAALVSAFERQTGIAVQVRSGDEDVLANQIAQEGSASPADVYYAENSPALQFLAEKGLLSAVTPATLARVPAQYNSPDGKWVGVSARVSGFVYNTSLLTSGQLPSSVLDLADPHWAGKLGLAPSETDFEPVVTSVARTYGDAAALRWLKALKSNASGHVYPDNESLIAAVNSGQVAIAIIDHYYWYRLHYEVGSSRIHSAFDYFAPRDPGYVVNVSGASVLRSSAHQAEAQRFVAFLVSDTGQQIIAHSQSYEYPLVSGVAAAQPLRPFDELQPTTLSIAELGDGRRAISLLQQAQVL